MGHGCPDETLYPGVSVGVFPGEISAWMVQCPPQYGWQENKKQRNSSLFSCLTDAAGTSFLTSSRPGTGICYVWLAWFSGLQLTLNPINTFLSLQLTETGYGASLPPLSHETWLGIHLVNAPLTRNSPSCCLSFVGTELNDISLHGSQALPQTPVSGMQTWSEVCQFQGCSQIFLQNVPHLLSFLTSHRYRPLVGIRLDLQVAEWRAIQWISNLIATWDWREHSLLSHWEFGFVHTLKNTGQQ